MGFLRYLGSSFWNGINVALIFVNLVFGVVQLIDGDFPFSLIVAVIVSGFLYLSYRAYSRNEARLRGMTNPYV
jgi:membrane protein implicated in regulation of membrane protease activity